jgi:hypothetical protein
MNDIKGLWNYKTSNTIHTVDCLNFKGRGTVVRFPAGAKDFSLLVGAQTGFGAHLASYQMGTGGCSPGSKATGA